MKKLLLLTGLLTSLFISCSKEEKTVVNDSIGNLENLEVHAVIGDNAVTKTVVQSNGTDIYWTQGDAINLFYGNRTSAQFTTSINSPSASASFQGSITAVTGTNGNGNGAQSFWGVYPYNSLNTCDGTGVTLTIPSEQSGVAGTFASNLNPTVATSPNLDLAFYNVGSWFVFSVTRNDIVSVTFQGNASETLVGKVRVEMDGNSHPVVTQVTNGVTSITMTPDGGGCFTSGEDYYMVLIPQTLSNGYSVTLNTSDGSFATCVVDGSREFPRSGARGKHNVDDGLSFPTYYIPIDLGLSVKWATFNVGATKPEEYGDYYAWGETEPYYEVGYAQESPQAHWKDGYSAGYVWSNYKWCNGSNTTLTKYNTSSSYGTVDNKTVLDPEDDVAHVKWGGSWRMPTLREQDELRISCTFTWYSSGNTEFNGVAGYKVTSKKSGYTDRFIFLPAAGFRLDTGLNLAGERGFYWSSSLDTGRLKYAWSLFFQSLESAAANNYYDYITTYYLRNYGLSVRPVCP